MMGAGPERDDARPEGERRRCRRIEMRLPLELRLAGESTPLIGMTHDVSANGVRFNVSRPLEPRREIEFLLVFPPEVTLCTPMKVKCTGRVVRANSENGAVCGVAATIDRFELLTDDAVYPFSNVNSTSFPSKLD